MFNLDELSGRNLCAATTRYRFLRYRLADIRKETFDVCLRCCRELKCPS